MKRFRLAFISANIIGVLAYVFLVQSCSKDTTKIPQQTICDSLGILTYSTDIKAILDQNCTSCHRPILHENNVDLSTYPDTKTAIEKYDIVCNIKFESGCVGMPNTGKMPDTLIQKIECWIKSGYPN